MKCFFSCGRPVFEYLHTFVDLLLKNNSIKTMHRRLFNTAQMSQFGFSKTKFEKFFDSLLSWLMQMGSKTVAVYFG